MLPLLALPCDRNLNLRLWVATLKSALSCVCLCQWSCAQWSSCLLVVALGLLFGKMLVHWGQCIVCASGAGCGAGNWLAVPTRTRLSSVSTDRPRATRTPLARRPLYCIHAPVRADINCGAPTPIDGPKRLPSLSLSLSLSQAQFLEPAHRADFSRTPPPSC